MPGTSTKPVAVHGKRKHIYLCCESRRLTILLLIYSGGDSGGPVIQYAGTTPVIVGIISAGVRCSRFGFPGIMVKIAGHKRFLNRSPANFRTKKRRLRQVRRSCPVGQFLVSPGGALAICINCPPGTTSTGGTTAACF